MRADKQKLMIEQFDKKINLLNEVSKSFTLPSKGWIYTIRKSLNMSQNQLAKKLNVSMQNISQLEARERNGTISITKLREVADSLEMKLVYALIPKEESLTRMIQNRAMEVAKEIVLRTSQSMSLEEQENNPERLEKAIREKAVQLQNELPRYLWD